MDIRSAVAMGFLKSDRIVSSPEFVKLPKHIQDYLQKETVPHYEITSVSEANFGVQSISERE